MHACTAVKRLEICFIIYLTGVVAIPAGDADSGTVLQLHRSSVPQSGPSGAEETG